MQYFAKQSHLFSGNDNLGEWRKNDPTHWRNRFLGGEGGICSCFATPLAVPEKIFGLPLSSIFSTAAPTPARFFVHWTRSLALPAPPALGFKFSLLIQKKNDPAHWRNRFLGVEGGIWTLAPVTQPTPLAGEPLHHLSTSPRWMCYNVLQKIGGEEGIRTLGSLRNH